MANMITFISLDNTRIYKRKNRVTLWKLIKKKKKNIEAAAAARAGEMDVVVEVARAMAEVKIKSWLRQEREKRSWLSKPSLASTQYWWKLRTLIQSEKKEKKRSRNVKNTTQITRSYPLKESERMNERASMRASERLSDKELERLHDAWNEGMNERKSKWQVWP